MGHNAAAPKLLVRIVAATAVVAVAVATHPSPGWAQSGWYLLPSLKLAEEFDDNVFVRSSGAESDFITRLSPGLEGGFRSAPLTLLGSYSFDSEAFVEHPELSDPANRKRAGLELRYVPDRRITLDFNVAFVETQTPGDLNTLTGVSGGRVTSDFLSTSAEAAYRLTPSTSGQVGYLYARSSTAGGVTNEAHQPTLRLTRQLTPLDSSDFVYRFSLFESDGAVSTTSHTFTLGWTRRLDGRTSFTLQAGPRISKDSIDPEVAVTLEHRFRAAKLTMSYIRSETTVVGQAGAVTVQAISGSLAFEPIRALEIGLAPAIQQAVPEGRSATAEVTVYSLNASASYQINKWLAARLSYRLSRQEQARTEILHNVLTIGLDLTYPFRVR